jgi:oligosaccharide repeat unit polymerase
MRPIVLPSHSSRVRAPQRDLLSPLYPAVCYFILLFVVRPLWDVEFGSPFLGDWPFEPDTSLAFVRSLFYAVFGLCLFLLGYSSPLGQKIGSILPRLPSRWNQASSSITIGLLTFLGAASLGALATFHGGWNAFVADRAAALTAPGQEYLRQGVALIPAAFLLALTLSIGSSRRAWLIVVAGGLILAALGIASGSKFEVLYPVLATVMAKHYLGGLKIGVRHVVVLALAAVVAFPILNNLRHSDSFESALSDTTWSASEVSQHLMARFYGIDALTLCVRDTPAVLDFQYGGTITPILTAWIPRALYPEKSVVSFGKIFAELYMGEHFAGTGTSASPTLLGDAYINFHIPGILIVSFLYGVLVRSLYTWTILLYFGAPAVFLYLAVLPLCATAWEGAVGATLVLAAAKIVPLLVIIWLAGEWRNCPLAPAHAKTRVGQQP